jgi:hypothetical protein
LCCFGNIEINYLIKILSKKLCLQSSLHIGGAIAKVRHSTGLGFRRVNAKHGRCQRAVCSLETCCSHTYSQSHWWPGASYCYGGCCCHCLPGGRVNVALPHLHLCDDKDGVLPGLGSRSCSQSTAPRCQYCLTQQSTVPDICS